MSRYVDAEALKTDILKKYKQNWEVPCSYEDRIIQRVVTDLRVLIEQNTPADVVPKSEADNLIKVIDNTTQQFLELHDFYQNAKSEVARLEQDVTRLVQENETLKDSNEHLAVMFEETKIELEAMRGAANSYKMHYENLAREIFEEIESIINEPFAVGFNLLAPLKQALGEYNNGIRKDLLYYIAELKKEYTEERE
jgi:regulator of replication initiation timing